VDLDSIIENLVGRREEKERKKQLFFFFFETKDAR
jgi:hypothetical protein